MHDNELLVEFEFLVDLDLAMFKLIRDKYSASEYVDQDFINEPNEFQIIQNLLNRKHINPLEIIMPEVDTANLYFELLSDKYKELLSYATAYDTFGLMITYLNNASSVGITVLCKSDIEADFIKQLNPILKTIVSDRKNIDLSNYTALYLKYLIYATNYSAIHGKHIFFAAAKFNMEEDRDLVHSGLVQLYCDTNELHLIDLYERVKFRFRKDEKKE